jgi:hypothetical protein
LKRNSKKNPAVSPDFLDKQRASLRRTHRQVIYRNEKELAVIDEYCRQFKISAKSALYRQAIMERILAGLDQNHPTLF